MTSSVLEQTLHQESDLTGRDQSKAPGVVGGRGDQLISPHKLQAAQLNNPPASLPCSEVGQACHLHLSSIQIRAAAGEELFGGRGRHRLGGRR